MLIMNVMRRNWQIWRIFSHTEVYYTNVNTTTPHHSTSQHHNISQHLTISTPRHLTISTPQHLNIHNVLLQPPPPRLPPYIPLQQRAARPSQQSAPWRTARRTRRAFDNRSRTAVASPSERTSAATGTACDDRFPAHSHHTTDSDVAEPHILKDTP